MDTPHSIERSRKAFSALLNLYPAAHRSEYGTAMLQVFTEQCRAAYAQKGVFGIVLLWLRTLPDVGYTSMLEHITAPGAAWGLMEPVPNAPLPWKGVVLVVLPGLVYLVSQVMQLSGTNLAYLAVNSRAALLLIIPVLVVWALTRRFPIWGLIPLGLLFRLLQELDIETFVMRAYVIINNPMLEPLENAIKLFINEPLISTSLFILAIALLAWRYARGQKLPRAFWLLLGAYILLAGAQVACNIAQQMQFTGNLFSMQTLLQENAVYELHNFSRLLLLVFIGSLFVKRHGFFAILVPLGYMLPAMLVGFYDNLESITSPVSALLVVSGAVLAYRGLLSLVVPIWMSRSSTQRGKIWVVGISVALALLIYAAMQVYSVVIYLGWMSGPTYGFPWDFISVALEELKIAGAMALAVVLYSSFHPTAQPASNPPAEAAALSASEA